MCNDMRTETIRIAKSEQKVIDLADRTVMKITGTDGKSLGAARQVYRQDDKLVLAYADGTSVALAL